MKDIETTYEGNYGENYEENLKENFEDTFEENFEKDFEENFQDNLEENFEQKFEENREENLKEKFEDPYFEEKLNLNRRYQISYKKTMMIIMMIIVHLQSPLHPTQNLLGSVLINKNIDEFRDQLCEKIIMHILLRQMELLAITDQ